MKNKKKINLNAFTLAESLVSLTVIAAIVTFTFFSIVNIDKDTENFIVTQTETFYNNASAIYQKIIFDNTSNSSDVSKIKDKNNDNEIDSKDLRDYFVSYFGDYSKDCSVFINPGEQVSNYLNGTACAELTPGVNAAFYLNTNCDTQIDNVKPYAVLNNYSVGKAENTCGYIMYSPKKAKELILGKTVFIIPLGRMFFK